MSECDNCNIFDTVSFDEEEGSLIVIDQTLLPQELKLLPLRTLEEAWEAIKNLRVRGAPAIGVAGAIALYAAARKLAACSYSQFVTRLLAAAEYLNSARPTAVNLSWALGRMENILKSGPPETEQALAALRREARAIWEEDIAACRAIGEHGLSLLRPGDGLLTHCNAGRLAAVRYGTATAPMYAGHSRGYNFKIFVDETRPLLQGARLTAYELASAGLDVTLICDHTAVTVMKKGLIQAVLVGCDRVAANGDAANKIGTLPLAIAARRYAVPFYVCAPASTVDPASATGDDIVIEERGGEEITSLWYSRPMAPPGCKTFNPAFDVTDHELVSAFVTEYGVIRPPFEKKLSALGRLGKL
ncbi:MAG: S-methyl-5-thioribose-1-phosphate isomerase [Desulfarculales bacterium]|jgi:methylthioribose-1-phosphate isomerase|nr:S-methyl-5-thioribose-1-phosphate isomerase [Desulfarculales bacterium]